MAGRARRRVRDERHGADVAAYRQPDRPSWHVEGLARLDRDASLSEHARNALRPWTSKLVVSALGVAAAARLRRRRWTRDDAVIAASMVALQPFSEWLIHVHVLHARPVRIAGRRVDLTAARSHRRHHLSPDDPNQVFIPPEDLAALLVAIGGTALLFARDGRRRLTHVATGLALVTVYEWMHYLIHSSWSPRTRWYRGVWRAHRWHHFRNEHYWFGVTNGIGDRVLGTYPDRSEVPVSGTARTLGLDAEGTAVEGRAVEGTAVEGTAVEGTDAPTTDAQGTVASSV